MAKNNSYQ